MRLSQPEAAGLSGKAAKGVTSLAALLDELRALADSGVSPSRDRRSGPRPARVTARSFARSTRSSQRGGSRT